MKANRRLLITVVTLSVSYSIFWSLHNGNDNGQSAAGDHEITSHSKSADGGRHTTFTIVTALFDIGRGNWSWQWTRPYSVYQVYMKQLLDLDINVVAFADPEGAKFVRQYRESRMHKTIVHEITIQQLPLFVHYHRIKDLMAKEQASWKAEWDRSFRINPECIYPEYDILMNSKVYFVNRAVSENPFGSEYFYWVDASYGHGLAVYPPNGTYWAPENLMKPGVGGKITFIQLVPGNLYRHTLEKLYRQDVAIVNGGFFGGNRRAIGEYYRLVNAVFEEMLTRGYIDDDQVVAVVCYQKNPALFHMVAGGWFDLFKMFRPPRWYDVFRFF